MNIEISFRWAVRLVSIIFGLAVALLHTQNLPVLNWLWNLRLFTGVPEILASLLTLFGLAWIWPKGK